MSDFVTLTEVGSQQRTFVNVDAIATVTETPEGSKVGFLDGTWLNVEQSYVYLTFYLARSS